jgi:hypothetical protein
MTDVDPWSMNAEQATAALNEMAKTFNANPADDAAALATAKLATLAKEHRLAEANGGQTSQPTIEQILTEQNAAAEQRDAAVIDQHLRDVGLSPETDAGRECAEYISGKRSITPEMRADLDAKIKRWGRDSEFQQLLDSGDAEATRLWGIATSMRCAPIAEAGK